MKKRILFVDDEPMVLQGIQRSLRPMRQMWDMDFAEDGASAKEYLAQHDYAVVLTDMMMPGMDGAELLSFVKEHAPRTIRLVLSGHAEQQLAMKCVGIAHQYLSKPCEVAMLRRTIDRVMNPSFAIRNEQVMTIIGRLEHLPSIPAMYSQIVRMLNDPHASIADVGTLIGGDMAMTAKVLQLVNSSFFGLSRLVSDPADAATFLGLDTLKALVLAANVFGQLEAKMPRGFSAGCASRHSQKVGAAARAIAQAEHAAQSVVDESLVAGLLHDVGKLVLASNATEEFQHIAANPELRPLDAERAAFGATHAEVGGYLLGLWGLPSPVVEAISLHHAPGESLHLEFSALTATHVADAIVSESRTSPVDMDYLTRLGLAERLPVWRAAVDELSPTAANCI